MSAPGLIEAPSFPPLLKGQPAAPGQDPMAKAVAAAALGADPGLVVWAPRADRMEAAMVLAPEVPLAEAMSGVFAIALGLGDALGALAPPEVAVHYDWPGGIRVNGGTCGRLRAAASTADPAAEPDWLVVGVSIDLLPENDEPGRTPERTCLHMEGCGEITALGLIESWSRHSLVWLNTWVDEGFRPLHQAWRGRAWLIGERLADGGTFMGLDEQGGQLVRRPDGTTELRPLTCLLAAT